jgi:hypothetical protein
MAADQLTSAGLTTTPGLTNTPGLSTGGTNTQGLADWAAPYVTGYLGQAKAQALEPYQAYGGPLTAGPSQLQSNVFSGLGSLNFPSNLGQSFSSTGAYQAPNIATMGAGTSAPNGPSGPTGIAANYMNPYLQSVLTPQLQELRRQNDITQQNTNAKMTAQGAFGGGRNAIMNAQNNADMMRQMNSTVGTGYANAYDKAMQQFNAEQGQSKSLADMMAQQGGVQQGITQAGTAADLAEFEKQRQYPYQQIQFQRDMMTGLPISSVTNTAGSLTGVGSILSALGGATGIASALQNKDVQALLKNLGLGSLTS